MYFKLRIKLKRIHFTDKGENKKNKHSVKEVNSHHIKGWVSNRPGRGWHTKHAGVPPG